MNTKNNNNRGDGEGGVTRVKGVTRVNGREGGKGEGKLLRTDGMGSKAL